MESVLSFTVSPKDTARAVGSGSLPVLGTPVLLAWCEAATCAAIEALLPPGSTSVGTKVELSHRAPSAIGQLVTVRASITARSERSVTFEVTAMHPDQSLVGTGVVERAVVDEARFLARLQTQRS